ncbi:hypothetical protein COV18_07240 [Candidatus Woesearchaeota archaeon CG10_big_fil_rev_8_21_14_0_10_37_12]|nr:MAG: hypothetical protein COV18_07240 [Candidatus Woesearchaeota archaeon CG10_big_fil_rev_8_21_14_0_10_37_12]
MDFDLESLVARPDVVVVKGWPEAIPGLADSIRAEGLLVEEVEAPVIVPIEDCDDELGVCFRYDADGVARKGDEGSLEEWIANTLTGQPPLVIVNYACGDASGFLRGCLYDALCESGQSIGNIAAVHTTDNVDAAIGIARVSRARMLFADRLWKFVYSTNVDPYAIIRPALDSMVDELKGVNPASLDYAAVLRAVNHAEVQVARTQVMYVGSNKQQYLEQLRATLRGVYQLLGKEPRAVYNVGKPEKIKLQVHLLSSDSAPDFSDGGGTALASEGSQITIVGQPLYYDVGLIVKDDEGYHPLIVNVDLVCRGSDWYVDVVAHSRYEVCTRRQCDDWIKDVQKEGLGCVIISDDENGTFAEKISRASTAYMVKTGMFGCVDE